MTGPARTVPPSTFSGPRAGLVPARPIRVGALVDLERRGDAGGHVKCWERFAEAAVSLGDELDLTVHFLGPWRSLEVLSENVRVVTLPAVFGTGRLGFLDVGSGHTDLSPFHPGLLRSLRTCDVLHATDVFAFGKTALLYAAFARKPLVCSLHTDLPRYSRMYGGEILRRLAGRHPLAGRLVARLPLAEGLESFLRWRTDRYLGHCDRVLVSREEDRRRLAARMPTGRIGRLRRGIDKDLFHPRRRDRARLFHELGIREDVPVLLFVGRVDPTKNVLTLGRAARALLDRGIALHVIVAGEGMQSNDLRHLLDSALTLAGNVPQRELAWFYASSDLFVFPSETEFFPNVVLEARASGLPVLVSGGDAGARLVSVAGVDGCVVEGGGAEPWADAIERLLSSPETRRRMGAAARSAIERTWPSWRDVLVEDLLPAWRAALEARRPKP